MLHILIGVQLLLGGGAWWSRVYAAQFPQPIPVMVTLTVDTHGHWRAGAGGNVDNDAGDLPSPDRSNDSAKFLYELRSKSRNEGLDRVARQQLSR